MAKRKGTGDAYGALIEDFEKKRAAPITKAKKRKNILPAYLITSSIATVVVALLALVITDVSGEVISPAQVDKVIEKSFTKNTPLIKAANRFVSMDNKPLESVLPQLNQALRRSADEPDTFDISRFVFMGKTAIYTDIR